MAPLLCRSAEGRLVFWLIVQFRGIKIRPRQPNNCVNLGIKRYLPENLSPGQALVGATLGIAFVVLYLDSKSRNDRSWSSRD